MTIRSCMAVVALCALLAVAWPGLAQGAPLPEALDTTPGPHVVVNGTLLKAPVQMTNGSLLLPMRAVFEALQAQVRWLPQAQQITATRGDAVVLLWINRGTAVVNRHEVTLAVPPTLFGDSTYVPLRFPAEAFGGEVKWNAKLQTAFITIRPLAAAGTPTVPEIAANKTGVLMKIVRDDRPMLFIQEPESTNVTPCRLAPNATITRGVVHTPAQPAYLADVQPGDRVIVTLDAAGNGTAVAATFAREEGVVRKITTEVITLENDAHYFLLHETSLTDADGHAVEPGAIAKGTVVNLRLTPGTANVWAVRVKEWNKEHVAEHHEVVPEHHEAVPEHHEALPKFSITAPEDKSRATAKLSVTGTAAPGAHVRVTIDFETTVLGTAVSTNVYHNTVTTDKDGQWHTASVDLALPVVKVKSYLLKADLLNDKGEAVQTIQERLAGK